MVPFTFNIAPKWKLFNISRDQATKQYSSWLHLEICSIVYVEFVAKNNKFVATKQYSSWQLEISFVEKMRTNWSHKVVHQTFFQNKSLYLRKCDLVLSTSYHLATSMSQFFDIKIRVILQKFSHTKKRDCQLTVVSSLYPNLIIWLLLLKSIELGFQYWCIQYAFYDVIKLRNAGLSMVRSQTVKNVFSQIRRIVAPQVVLISWIKLILSSISSIMLVYY